MTLFRWLGRDPFFLPYKPGKFKTASPLSFLIDCIFFLISPSTGSIHSFAKRPSWSPG